MLTLIRGGDVHGPDPRGRHDVLLVRDAVARIGSVDQQAIERLGLDLYIIDAEGGLVLPGLVDAHAHLIGGSGERGFASQSPGLRLDEIVTGGITTIVGCLGVDTITRTMPALVARARALHDYGLSAYVYTGGYDVPPRTLLESVRHDLLFVPEVLGAGEIAISDARSSAPSVSELARVVHDAHVGGLLSGKAGITHLHVGDGPGGLAPLRALLDDHAIAPSLLYPTHVQRHPRLLQEAVEIAGRGVTVDVDVVDGDLAASFRVFVDSGGDPSRLTASSDASITSPGTLLAQLRDCVQRHGLPLEHVLRLVTTTPAQVLGLARKGHLRPGADADVVVLDARTMELRAVVARGHVLLDGGAVRVSEAFIPGSNRRVHWQGGAAPGPAGAPPGACEG